MFNIKKTIKEDPDTIKDNKSGYTHRYQNKDAVVFGVFNDNVYFKEYDKEKNEYVTHKDLAFEMKSSLGLNIGFNRDSFVYPGRLWLSPRLISFWEYPSQHMFYKIIKALERGLKINIINNYWRVEVFDKKNNRILVPVEKYTGEYYDPTNMGKEHVASPLKKKTKKPSYNKYKKLKTTPVKWRFHKEKNVAEDIIKEEINKTFLKNKTGELESVLENKYGVDLFIYYSIIQNVLVISSITVPKEKRNQGIGTKVMNEICDFADKNNLPIILTPSSDFGGNKKRLIKFYKYFDFVKNKDYKYRELMIRHPQ